MSARPRAKNPGRTSPRSATTSAARVDTKIRRPSPTARMAHACVSCRAPKPTPPRGPTTRPRTAVRAGCSTAHSSSRFAGHSPTLPGVDPPATEQPPAHRRSGRVCRGSRTRRERRRGVEPFLWTAQQSSRRPPALSRGSACPATSGGPRPDCRSSAKRRPRPPGRANRAHKPRPASVTSRTHATQPRNDNPRDTKRS